MNKPQIRFKGFEDEWKQSSFGALLNYIQPQSYIVKSSKYKTRGIPVLTAGKSLLLGYTDERFGVFNNLPCILFDDFTTDSKFIDYPFKVKSSAAKMLVPFAKDANIYLLYLIMQNTSFEHSSHRRYWINEYSNIPIFLPSNAEQKQLTYIFAALDEMIAETEREVNRLEKMKQASLQKMFPRPGATTPEIRFVGFSEPWVIRSIGSCFAEGNERGGYDNLLSVGITRGVYPTEDFVKTVTVKDFSNYKTVHEKDIVYNSMRMWQGASGVSNYNGIVSPAYTILTPKDNVWSPFFAYLFKLPWVIKIFEANSQGLTKDTWNLKYPAISIIEFAVPSDMKEQIYIANYFKKLDALLSAKRQKLAKLRNIKQACLDKMFVNTSEL